MAQDRVAFRTVWAPWYIYMLGLFGKACRVKVKIQGLFSRPPEQMVFRRSERHSEHFRVLKLDIINTDGPPVAHACQTATEGLLHDDDVDAFESDMNVLLKLQLQIMMKQAHLPCTTPLAGSALSPPPNPG